MKIGVFLARMQPIHNAHIYVVEKMCKENDRIVVILGSSNKDDMLRNPFPIKLRITMLKDAIADSIGAKYANKIEVFEIPDWTHEQDVYNKREWGLYFYYNVVSRIKSKKFNLYFSDDPNIMLSWFTDEILKRISFVFMERSTIFEGLSATKIREAFENKDREYIKDNCPLIVSCWFDILSEIWFNVKANPKKDFSMK